MSALRKLSFVMMAERAIPDGGGIAAVLELLSDPQGLAVAFFKGQDAALAEVQAVREAPEPNPWKEASDEEIAQRLLDDSGALKYYYGGKWEESDEL